MERIYWLFFLSSMLIPTTSLSTVYYVSNSGNNSNDGSEASPWLTINHAEDNVEAGDTVYIMAGVYEESVWMSASGNSTDGYISFIGLGFVQMQGNPNLDQAFATSNSSYIHIENITILDYHREGIAFYGSSSNPMSHVKLIQLNVLNSGISYGVWDHGIQVQYVNQFLIDKCYTYNNQGNNIYVNNCQYGAVMHSTANGPTNGVYRDDSDGITVQNSKYIRVAHCIANNNFEDGIDIGGNSGMDVAHISVYNCIANNNLDDGLCFSVTNGSEFDGYDVTFAKCLAVGNVSSGLICYQQPDDVKIIHNTIVGNKWGLNIRNENPQNFKIKNNIFAFQQNHNFATNNIDPSIFEMTHTNWYNQVPPNPYEGDGIQNENPMFAQQAGANFELTEASPCIDFGTALTETASAGTGTLIPVEYAGYFCDGFGVVTGDTIRVGNQTVTIISIPNNQTIIVDQPISWNAGDPINFNYSGLAADLGWHEYIDESCNDCTEIQIWAAGSTGEELIQLDVCGTIVTEWQNVGGDFSGGSFVELNYTHPSAVSLQDIKLIFPDGRESSIGEDMNIRVDKIALNGVSKETEDMDVMKDGAYNGACASGFYNTERLYCSGYIWYGWKCTPEMIHQHHLVGTGNYQVADKIESQAIVSNAEDVQYRADEIVLRNKFEVELGAVFQGTIEPCNE